MASVFILATIDTISELGADYNTHPPQQDAQTKMPGNKADECSFSFYSLCIQMLRCVSKTRTVEMKRGELLAAVPSQCARQDDSVAISFCWAMDGAQRALDGRPAGPALRGKRRLLGSLCCEATAVGAKAGLDGRVKPDVDGDRLRQSPRWDVGCKDVDGRCPRTNRT